MTPKISIGSYLLALLLISGMLWPGAQAKAKVVHDPKPVSLRCQEPDPGASYYTIDLVTTKNVPGTGAGNGEARMMFKPNPFGISVARDGSYQHLLKVQLHKVNPPKKGKFAVWVTTPSLDKVKYMGTLDEDLKLEGTVDWNKYLVVVTLEKEGFKNKNMWNGPIAFRGLSKSGLMHTMAGHGPFEQEPCAKYGYY